MLKEQKKYSVIKILCTKQSLVILNFVFLCELMNRHWIEFFSDFNWFCTFKEKTDRPHIGEN